MELRLKNSNKDFPDNFTVCPKILWSPKCEKFSLEMWKKRENVKSQVTRSALHDLVHRSIIFLM